MSDVPEVRIDPGEPVDVDAVMRQIREYIVAHKLQTNPEAAALPHFSGQLNSAVYEHLYQAALIHDQLGISMNVVPSRAPIIGGLMTALRRKLHELTLYYVNQLAQKQITFNIHILGAVNGLAHELEAAPPSATAELKREVETLRQQVRALEEQR